ncbi:MepB family protein [Flammeovirgaceae bacterium]
MHSIISRVTAEVYDKCGFIISDYKSEPESKEYDACQFKLNGQIIISRTAKITPKKIGQFVTFWKRNKKGIIAPFSERDNFDFYVINVEKEDTLGQFVFPKSILIDKGVVATRKKDGKRGFRVYPSWDTVNNEQATKAQKWQLDYFFEIGVTTDLRLVEKLYNQ